MKLREEKRRQKGDHAEKINAASGSQGEKKNIKRPLTRCSNVTRAE
jgi:hypothetical protein